MIVAGVITVKQEHPHARGINAFDGSINSYWDGRSTTSWLTFDAGRRRVALSYKIATKHTGCPRQWQFQGSNVNKFVHSKDFAIIDARMNGICNRARFAHYSITGKLEVFYSPESVRVEVRVRVGQPQIGASSVRGIASWYLVRTRGIQTCRCIIEYFTF